MGHSFIHFLKMVFKFIVKSLFQIQILDYFLFPPLEKGGLYLFFCLKLLFQIVFILFYFNKWFPHKFSLFFFFVFFVVISSSEYDGFWVSRFSRLRATFWFKIDRVVSVAYMHISTNDFCIVNITYLKTYVF